MVVLKQVADVPHEMTTTGLEIPGYRIVQNVGVVRGVVVRSRSIIGTLGGKLQTLVGGNIGAFTKLAEQARAQAYETMLHHAHEAGANAVIGVRYDAGEIMPGVTEVLCYGTGVVVETTEG